ncbi:MAG: hypothetical protein LUE64_00805 [Candidatus Gastranaerophilales bacterium]|nr:hypothetical protein [Candidatus Gastranaerophilales bacterium]
MQGSAPYELKIYALIFCYCSAGLLLAATPAFILRKKKIKDLTKGKYLKSIELLDDGVKFNYNKFHFDFSVGFSDIKELKYIIYTCKRNAGLASAICIDNKKICFYLNDGSVIDVYVPFTLSCVELGYTLFNFARNIKKFTYEFSGPGEPPGIREKLDDYKEKGFKPVLSSQEASCYKKASLIFFLIGIALAVFLKIFFPDITVNEPLFVLICISPFLFISFMLDLYFFVDKSIEKFKNGK